MTKLERIAFKGLTLFFIGCLVAAAWNCLYLGVVASAVITLGLIHALKEDKRD